MDNYAKKHVCMYVQIYIFVTIENAWIALQADWTIGCTNAVMDTVTCVWNDATAMNALLPKCRKLTDEMLNGVNAKHFYVVNAKPPNLYDAAMVKCFEGRTLRENAITALKISKYIVIKNFT